MIKRTTIVSFITALAMHASAQQVTIIESQSGNWWAIQDSIWHEVAVNMGFTSTVVPQSTLDNISNLSGTDILVVSSGTIPYAGTNHLLTIVLYVMSGRPVYIQSEYTTTYQGSITFDSLMTALGSDFQWTGTVSGSLVPMNVTGDLATTPNAVSTLGYYNYGLAGTGTDVQTFLERGGQFFGFYFPGNGNSGCVITQSDEDWVWNNASQDLMANMLAKIQNCTTTSIAATASAGPAITVPGLFSDHLDVVSTVKDPVRLELYDMSGRVVRAAAFTGQTSIDGSTLPPGLYIHVVRASDGRMWKGRTVKS